MLKQLFLAVACVLCHSANAATAATIYKCTNAGKVSYNDRPCGASTVELAVQGAPAGNPEALARLARERAMLQEIEAARAAREEKEARTIERTQRAAAVQQRRCDKLRLQRKWADEEVAQAGRDGSQRARTKARRQAELLAVECPA